MLINLFERNSYRGWVIFSIWGRQKVKTRTRKWQGKGARQTTSICPFTPKWPQLWRLGQTEPGVQESTTLPASPVQVVRCPSSWAISFGFRRYINPGFDWKKCSTVSLIDVFMECQYHRYWFNLFCQYDLAPICCFCNLELNCMTIQTTILVGDALPLCFYSNCLMISNLKVIEDMQVQCRAGSRNSLFSFTCKCNDVSYLISHSKSYHLFFKI